MTSFFLSLLEYCWLLFAAQRHIYLCQKKQQHFTDHCTRIEKIEKVCVCGGGGGGGGVETRGRCEDILTIAGFRWIGALADSCTAKHPLPRSLATPLRGGEWKSAERISVFHHPFTQTHHQHHHQNHPTYLPPPPPPTHTHTH